MVDSSDNVREFFRNEILEAIPAIRKKNKRPDSKTIFSYICHQESIQEMSQRNCHFKGSLCLKKLYYQNFS